MNGGQIPEVGHFYILDMPRATLDTCLALTAF